MCTHGDFSRKPFYPSLGWGGRGARHRPFLTTGFVSPEVNRVLRVFFKIVITVPLKKSFH